MTSTIVATPSKEPLGGRRWLFFLMQLLDLYILPHVIIQYIAIHTIIVQESMNDLLTNTVS
jgi:hypothetical protein